MSNLNQTDKNLAKIDIELDINEKDYDDKKPIKNEFLDIDDNENEIEMTEKYLESKFTFLDNEDDDIVKDALHYVKKYYKPSKTCLLNYFLRRIPIISWILKYDFKNNFLKDLVAGLTLGIVHIPTTMAYSQMAGLPPINGLYTTFFTIVTYMIFGSSRNLIVGTFSITALMVNTAVENGKGVLYKDITSNKTVDSSNFISNDPIEAKIMIATALAFVAGIIHIGCAILNLGVVTKYLSDSIVHGFTTAASYQILVSQLNSLLGLKIARTTLPLAVIGNLIEIFRVIEKTNIATFIISIICILFLYFSKTQINDRFKKKLPLPIPFELLVVIIATMISYFAQFKERWSVIVVGPMPSGFPSPKVPGFKIISNIISDAISIAIVTYAINISIAKVYAKKHNYEIRPNQEFFAYGIGNIATSFFSGFTGCVGLARCIIFDGIGGKTQFSSIFSSGLVLLVLLFLGPQLKYLPNTVLSCIVVTALLNKLLEISILPKIWRKSKIEAIGWVLTFGGVIIFNADIGLYIGIGSSIVLFFIQTQRPKATILGQLQGTDLFEDIRRFKEAKEIDGIKIIRYERSVYFANVDNFKYKIMKLSNLNINEMIEKINQQVKKIIKEENKSIGIFKKLRTKTDESKNIQLYNQIKQKMISDIKIKHVILDCSCMNYIDSQGIDALELLKKTFKEFDVQIYLSYCKESIVGAYKKFMPKDTCDLSNIYITTNDAVKHSVILMNKRHLYEIDDHNNKIEFVHL